MEWEVNYALKKISENGAEADVRKLVARKLDDMSEQKATRTRLNLAQKAEIVRLLRIGVSSQDVQKKFNCSRRFVFSVKQNSESILQAASSSNLEVKTSRQPKYPQIERLLFEFTQFSRSARLPVTGPVLEAKAIAIREKLLSKSTDESRRSVLEGFSASGSWLQSFLNRNSLRSVKLQNDSVALKGKGPSLGARSLQEKLAEYDPEWIFGLCDTALFYKLFPKQNYVLDGNDKSKLRLNKNMKAKDRISAYVCTNATGTLRVPLAIIGKAGSPRCFQKGSPAVAYFSQKNAWSDLATFRRWYDHVFLPFVRQRTSRRVALVMDTCGPHGSDIQLFNEQISFYRIPRNCSTIFQPMDMGVIAAFKIKYREMLVSRISAQIGERDRLRAAADTIKQSLRGLDEGYDPHLLDASELARDAWDQVSKEIISCSWVRSDLLPKESQGRIRDDRGEIRKGEAIDLSQEKQALIDSFFALRQGTMTDNSFLPQLQAVDGFEEIVRWAVIEEDSDVRIAMVNEALDEVERYFYSKTEIDESPKEPDEAEAEQEPSKEGTAAISSLVEIMDAFKDAQSYVDKLGVSDASDAVRRAKRALIDAFHEQSKKQKT